MTTAPWSPSELRSIERADVYKGDRLAGRLVRDGSNIAFSYRPEYLADPDTPAVAWSLPKTDVVVEASGESVPPFFAGLLPEGARLGAVVTATRTSVDDHFTLLLAVGSDAIGDVRVVPEGAVPASQAPALDADAIGTADLSAVFAEATGPGTLDLDSAAIPGVQAKVSASMMSTPVTTGSGPAILKLNPPREYPRLVENEAFFLAMARGCDLDAPDHVVVTDRHGRTALLVRRFDRHVDSTGAMTRLAQEDACQVLAVYPARKYRVRTEDVITTLAGTCERGGGSRTVAALRLLRLVAFSYLIGNGDLHGKNFSIRRHPSEGWEVTPAYDLVCTQPYLSWRDPMALDLYGRANRLTRPHLVAAGQRWGLRQRAVERMLDRLCARAEPWVDRIDEIGFDAPGADRIRTLIAERLTELRAP